MHGDVVMHLLWLCKLNFSIFNSNMHLWKRLKLSTFYCKAMALLVIRKSKDNKKCEVISHILIFIGILVDITAITSTLS